MVELRLVNKEEKEILRNLLEKYDYEFSQYTKVDINNLGLFGYDYFDYYWTEKNRFPYFILVDGKLAGFVLVNDFPEVENIKTDFCISEFFVLYKYRKQGVGSIAAKKAFDLHRGKWLLKRHPHNIASVYFWDKVVNEYTNGNYKLVNAYPDKKVDFEDGTPADVFFFEN